MLVRTIIITVRLFNRVKATVCFSLAIRSSLWSQILTKPHTALNNPLIMKLAQRFGEAEALKAQKAPLQINTKPSTDFHGHESGPICT